MNYYRQLGRSIPRWAGAVIAGIALFAVASLAAPPDAGAQDVVAIRYANAAPAAPTALNLGGIGLTWTPGEGAAQVFCLPQCVLHLDVGSAASYVIESRKMDTYSVAGELIAGTSWEQLDVLRGSPPEASWSGTTQVGYEYRVRACNAYGCSGWSPTAALAAGIS